MPKVPTKKGIRTYFGSRTYLCCSSRKHEEQYRFTLDKILRPMLEVKLAGARRFRLVNMMRLFRKKLKSHALVRSPVHALANFFRGVRRNKPRRDPVGWVIEVCLTGSAAFEGDCTADENVVYNEAGKGQRTAPVQTDCCASASCR